MPPSHQTGQTARIYAAAVTLSIGILVGTGFASVRSEKFDTITVERINVVEKDGRLRMVIANRERSPAVLNRGRPIPNTGANRAGLIFYNDEETENGGLISSGHRNADGTFEAEHSLTFDQFEQDQVIALQYIDANGTRRQGLQIIDRPPRTIWDQDSVWRRVQRVAEGPSRDSAVRAFRAEFPAVQRLYVGRDRGKNAMVLLGDGKGRTRLRLSVDSAGVARIEFLDEKGAVTHRIPDAK